MDQPAADTQTSSHRAIVLLGLAAFASSASVRVIDAELPRIAQTFDAPVMQAAHAITAFAAGYGVMQLFYGPLGDRFGKFRLINLLTAACAISTLMCALAPTLTGLIAARFCAGATAAGIVPLALAWIGDAVPYEQRRTVLARFLSAQICGMASGTFMGGFAAEHFSWRLPLWALAAWFAGICVLLYRHARTGLLNSQASAVTTPRTVTSAVLSMMVIFRGRWSQVVLTAAFIEGFFFYGAYAFVPTLLHVRNDLSLTLAGSVTMSLALGGLAYSALARPIVSRLPESVTAMIGGCVMAIALPAVCLLPGYVAPVTCSVIGGFGFYMMHNTLQSSAIQMSVQHRGVAVALFAAVFFLGQSVGASLIGILVQRLNPVAIFAVCGLALFCMGAGFAYRYRRTNLAVRSGTAA